VDAAGDLPQLVQHVGHPGGHVVQLLHQLAGPGWYRCLRGAQL
jgi:hypothetical protein